MEMEGGRAGEETARGKTKSKKMNFDNSWTKKKRKGAEPEDSQERTKRGGDDGICLPLGSFYFLWLPCEVFCLENFLIDSLLVRFAWRFFCCITSFAL